MAPTHHLDGKKILIVDDEPDILETLTDLLDMCVTDTAQDFETAASMLEKNTYDMTVSLSGATTCVNDGHEPNETLAAVLPPYLEDLFIGDGMLCADEVDWYAFNVTAGNTIRLLPPLIINAVEARLLGCALADLIR